MAAISARKSHAPAAMTCSDCAIDATASNKTAIVDHRRRGSLRRLPESIKIEPIVRRQATIVLKPRHVALHDFLDGLVCRTTEKLGGIGDEFKVDVVSRTAAIQPNHENHGPVQDRRESKRSNRKARIPTEKFDRRLAFAVQTAIGQDADQMALVKP